MCPSSLSVYDLEVQVSVLVVLLKFRNLNSKRIQLFSQSKIIIKIIDSAVVQLLDAYSWFFNPGNRFRDRTEFLGFMVTSANGVSHARNHGQ